MIERQLKLAEPLKAYSPDSCRSTSPSIDDKALPLGCVPVIQTHSEPFSSGVTLEQPGHFTGSPDEIILATIRIVRKVPRPAAPIDGLPERPVPRNFFRRVRTRVLSTEHDWYKDLRVMRMPRREYQRFHKRDLQGHYDGTEPEREWDDEMIWEAYGRYQGVPLRSVPI